MELNKNISVWRGNNIPPTDYHLWEKEDGSLHTKINEEWLLLTSPLDKSTLDRVELSVDNHLRDTNNPHKVTKALIGLDKVTNDALLKRAELGVASGVASLDSTGKVPLSLLPSYVDDFIIKGNTIKTSEIDFTTDTLQKFNDSISSDDHVIRTQYSVVDTTHNNIVGQMFLIGDSLGHMVTEILTTSATLNNGVIDWDAHSDTEVNTYIRRNHVKEGGTSSIAVGSWSKWTYYSGEGQYNDFKTLVAKELSKKVNTSDVVQQTGNSTTSVMSQNAVSHELATKADTEQVNNSLYNLEKKIEDRVVNLPDEEDLTYVKESGRDVLKLADRRYAPENFSGKGYKILRKNIVNGKNVLTQDMINEPYTHYIVQYDFDLNGAVITLSRTCSIEFKGGTFRNGTLVANTILGNGNTVYCGIETVYHNYFIENLVIDCGYNYDYALVVNASTYGKIANVRCLKYNRYGIYIKEGAYECIINNFECLSYQNLTNYKYNCGIYCDSTDCVFTSGIIKHNYCGIVLTKGGCNLTNIHIWGEIKAIENDTYNFENSTKVGIVLKSSNNLLNNIYFDSITYDFNNDDGKKGYELLDENIDYSYKGGVALIFDGTNGCYANILSNIKFFISGKTNTENKKKIYCITQIGSGAKNNIIANVVLDDTFIVNKNFYLYNGEINDYNTSLPYVININPLYNIINNVATRLKFANITDIVRYKDSYGGLFTDTWHSDGDETISSFYDRDMYNGKARIVKIIKDGSIKLSLRDKNGDEFYNETITSEKNSISVPLEFNFIPKNLSDIDLNTIIENGFYKFDNTCTNKPNNNRTDSVYASLLVINNGGTGVTQMAIYDQMIALRTFYPSTQVYGGWFYIFNNANEGMGNMPKNPIIGQTYINSILNQYSIYTKDWYDIKLIKHDAKTYGNTEERPILDNNRTDKGFQYFDNNLNKPIWWNGTEWVDSEGNDADSTPITSGTFANKPTKVNIGYAYFCTDRQTTEGSINGIMIYYKGSDIWVDALGRTVS